MSCVFSMLFSGFLGTVEEVFFTLLPIVVVFLVLQFTALRLKKHILLKILYGFVIVFVGLILFMQGVYVAFVPVGTHLGETIAALPNNWVLVPIGFVMGFLAAFAEPAIHVMIRQVEEMSSGAIKAKVMLVAISIGVAAAVGLAMLRLITGISLWWFILPGYALVFIMARFVDPTFIAMAFDNGGVATGPMCSTFIMSMSLAIAAAIPGRNPVVDGFGIVSLIAMAPILTTMMLSFVYKRQKPVPENSDTGVDNSAAQV